MGKTLKKIFDAGKIIVLNTLLLTSCEYNKPKEYPNNNIQYPKRGVQETSQETEEEIPKPYFAFIGDVDWDSGIALTTGDFNNDGNLDLIFGAAYNSKTSARLNYYEGDGKGNFKLKKFYDKDIQKSE